MLAEFLRKKGVGPRWPLVIAFGVLGLFLLIVLAFGQATDEDLRFLLIWSVVMLICIFMPQWLSWLSLRNAKKQNDGVVPESVLTFGETIEMHEGNAHFTFEYRKIAQVVRLNHSYVLMLGKRNGIILRTDCFTKGSFAEFKQFLREKRPDLDIPE